MNLQKRFGILVAGALVAVPALYSSPGEAQGEGHAPPPAAPPPAPSAQGQGQKTGGIETAVLVLDASGSMGDMIGSESRMKVAKDAIRKLISGWDQDVPLGLTAYGHRDASCGDIETLIPVGPIDKTAFMSAVDDLQPNGNTPLTAAVMAAAEQLDYTNNQATVILVSDGAENCNLDPCAVAKDLESKGIDLTVHVVGFGVSSDVGETKLACIAKNTGGQYKTASDAASLTSALTGMVTDVKERKKVWRKRWGNGWGKNGRWTGGCWQHGKPQGFDKWHSGRKKYWRKH